MNELEKYFQLSQEQERKHCDEVHEDDVPKYASLSLGMSNRGNKPTSQTKLADGV